MNKPPSPAILLVEDNPQDLELTLLALKRARLDEGIEIARDGAEALEFIFGPQPWTKESRVLRPRLMLLDLKLPKFDGIEVIARLKGDPRTRSVPIVVLTSSRESRDIAESYRLGVNSYIVKPVDFEGFAGALREVGHYWLTLNQSLEIN